MLNKVKLFLVRVSKMTKILVENVKNRENII